MSGIRVRASRCLLAALVTMTAACAADAPRAVGPPAPIEELSIGSFGTAQSIRGLLTFLSAEPLITIGWDGTPTFRIAESATLSEDGSQMKLRLRSNVKFHNGAPVTAEAARALLQSALIGKSVTTITADDELTLTLTLIQPFGFKVEDLSTTYVSDE